MTDDNVPASRPAFVAQDYFLDYVDTMAFSSLFFHFTR